jgi:ABC-2 type transport system permease protein
LAFWALMGQAKPQRSTYSWVYWSQQTGRPKFWASIPRHRPTRFAKEQGFCSNILLASRLSNQAILFGKVCTAVSYGWGLTLLILFLGLVTVNLVHGCGELLLYQGIIGLGSIALSLLGAGLAASAGALISLRASTVRQAQQTLSFAAWLLPIILGYGGRALPVGWRAHLVEAITASGMTGIMFVAIATLIVLDIGLLAVAMARFQRARLILD